MNPVHRFRPEQTHASVYIAPGAVVVDDVTIGAGSSVWYNAVIRGDCAAIRIGRGTNVQDGAVIHVDPGFPCELGDSVTIGHRAIVHGAAIGDNTVIGMGSVIQNGAKIGANSLVAAGSVVTEHSEFPPGSLVMGVPARLKRALEPHEIELNRYAADHYTHNAEEFAQAGQALRGTAG